MKLFHCDHCKQQVYFENSVCLKCGHLLAYLSDVSEIRALEPLEGELWTSLASASSDQHSETNCENTIATLSTNDAGTENQEQRPRYRLCQNYVEHNICNWAVPENDPSPLCQSCRLTWILPDLSVPGNKEHWYNIETAKRRLIYNLMTLGLPITSRVDDPVHGLTFSFMADDDASLGPRILTGHDEGVIVLNLAEADDVERERRRLELHEPYRTLLGHFRHEIGHYYWDILIRNSDRIEAFRELFGDERADYAEALQRHYSRDLSVPLDDQYISAYASSHPWEDWAECFANYLHIVGTLETADALGLKADQVPLSLDAPEQDQAPEDEFRSLINRWLKLTFLLNNLNRSLGLRDGYPFVLSEKIIEKLRFIHLTIDQTTKPQSSSMPLEQARAA